MESVVSEIFIEVLLEQGLQRPLDYSISKGVPIEVGMRVEVPLKSTLKKGIVIKVKSHSNYKNVKPIHKILSSQAELSEPLWKLAHWMSRYYAAPLSKVMRCLIPTCMRKGTQEKTKVLLKLLKTHAETLHEIERGRQAHPAQAECLEEVLQASPKAYLSDLKASAHTVQALIKKGWLVKVKVPFSEDLLLEEEFFSSQPKTLNREQQTFLLPL